MAFLRTDDDIDVLISSPQRSVARGFEWPRFAADVLTAMQKIRATQGGADISRNGGIRFPKKPA